GWRGDGLHLVDQVEQRWTAFLHAAHGQGRSFGGMFGQLIGKFAPAAGILVLVLYARRPKRVGFGRFFHRQFFETLGGGLRLLGEFGPLAGCRTVTATGDDNRTAALRVGESKMQRGKAAHRKSHNVRLIDFQSVKYGADVVACTRLRIPLTFLRHIRGRIAARIEGHAAIIFREVPNLLFVGTVVAGELMDKDYRNAFAGFLVVKLDPVVGRQVWHESLIQKCVGAGGKTCRSARVSRMFERDESIRVRSKTRRFASAADGTDRLIKAAPFSG